MRRTVAALALGAATSVGLLACEERSPVATEAEPVPEAPEPSAVDPCVRRADAAARRLGNHLKTRLVAALGQGPEAAVQACAEEAQAIHRQVAEETGVRVGRTASKLRNPTNAESPAWVRAYLQQHAESRMPTPTVRERRGLKARVLLPLGASGICQTCHGVAVSPQVRAVLAERYPDDEAVGFAPDDLRGVLWAEADCDGAPAVR